MENLRGRRQSMKKLICVLLLSVFFLCSCELPGEGYIAKAELIYRVGALEEMLIPYYRFYVLLPDMDRDNGLHCYGAYYVPAVAEEYIANMPVYDGRFN